MSATTDQANELLAQLEQGVSALVTSQDWLDLLAVQARFHTYSPNNQMLIWLQMPHATRVAGFHDWRKKFKRHVRKGEKCQIRILAPMTYRRKDDETGEYITGVRGFKTACVFDVSQTEGEPLPEIPIQLVTGDDSDRLRDRLAELVRAAGYRVEITPGQLPEHSEANGITDHLAQLVKVRGDLPPAQQAKTMAHELAHVMMHKPSDPNRPSDRGAIEVEAESVAYVVLGVSGIAADGYSVPYVAAWSGSDLAVIRGTAERVGKCAQQILKDLGPEAEAERTLIALGRLVDADAVVAA